MGHGQAGCANCRLQCSAGAVQWVVQLRRGWTLVRCTGGRKASAEQTRNEAHGWDPLPGGCMRASLEVVCEEGYYQRMRTKQLNFQSPSHLGEEPEACVSTGARVPRAGASAARRTRPVKKEKKAVARKAPTAGEAHRMHAGNPLFDPRGVSPDTWRLDKECRWKGARSNERTCKKKREDKLFGAVVTVKATHVAAPHAGPRRARPSRGAQRSARPSSRAPP